MLRVLLTGTTSFIGQHVAKFLAQSGIRVIATYRTPKCELMGALSACSQNLELIQLNISDESGFNKLPESIDAVVHVEGVSNMPGVSIDDMLAVNVNGTRNVQSYAMRAGARKFVYISSLSIHGRISASFVTENTPINQQDIYGCTKYLGERLLADKANAMPTIALRLPGVLGIGAHRAWIPSLVEKLLSDKEVSIYSPKAEFNNAIHVTDLSQLIGQILLGQFSNGFVAFPVGAAGKKNILDVASLLKQKLNSKSILHVQNLVKSSFTIDSTFASNCFGYVPRQIDQILMQYIEEISQSK
jgi:UDP-glucose 4-epimerase